MSEAVALGESSEASGWKRSPPLAVAYVGARLPSLSETFVSREWLGMRARGHHMTAVSVHRPEPQSDPDLAQIAQQAIVVYSPNTLLHLAPAIIFSPRLAIAALVEAFRADIPGLPARAKYLFQAWMGLAVARRLRGRGVEHVHAHLANVPATVGLHLARGLRVQFSFTGHAADLFVHRSALALKLRESAFVASISHWHADFYRRIEPGVEAPVVRCSVAPAPYLPEPTRAHVVLVGRLVAKKGVDLLIEAVHRLHDPAVQLTIAGDGPERDRLEDLTARLGLGDRVRFLGARPHRECLELIRRSTLFVLPSRSTAEGDRDGIPVVLMEAMAAGRAVIAGNLPTIAELVHHGKNGLLVRPDDVEALSAALRALLADDAERQRLGSAARQWTTEEFSDDVNLCRLETAMQQFASEWISGRAAARGSLGA